MQLNVAYYGTFVRLHRHWSTFLDAVDVKRPRSFASGILDKDKQGFNTVVLALDDGGWFRFGWSLELHNGGGHARNLQSDILGGFYREIRRSA